MKAHMVTLDYIGNHIVKGHCIHVPISASLDMSPYNITVQLWCFGLHYMEVKYTEQHTSEYVEELHIQH